MTGYNTFFGVFKVLTFDKLHFIPNTIDVTTICIAFPKQIQVKT